MASWIEVHVEQGRRLVDVPAALGVATSLAARERWRCTLRGVSDHAGTAAMEGRRDALVPAARAVLAAHDLARAEPGAVATVGRISALPGSTNQVPGEARLSLDVRAPEQAALERVRDGVLAAARGRRRRGRMAARDGRPRLRLRRGAARALHEAARAEGQEAVDLAAYAGHDAGVLARHLPAAMLFVRNPTGISHNPAESASEEDCLAACAVLARTLVRDGARAAWLLGCRGASGARSRSSAQQRRRRASGRRRMTAAARASAASSCVGDQLDGRRPGVRVRGR